MPTRSIFHRTLSRAAQPLIMFPLIGLLSLAAVWGTTIGIIRVRHTDAERAAAVSSQELLETYEAQVIRALREIDQSLNIVRYWHEREPKRGMLAELKLQGLLPPDLLFVVSITNREGKIVDSTRAGYAQNIADQDYFREQRDRGSFYVGNLPPGRTREAQLHFSRRLEVNGVFDGVVVVSADAAYFVSGYEAARFGAHGVLGLLGTDGVFRVRRTGESIYSGDLIDYAATVPKSGVTETEASVSSNSWDGVRRWTDARKLYGFPLAILVGLSADEQVAAVVRDAHTYLWRAAAASALVIVLLALLARMSWQLTQVRLREADARLVYAQLVEYLAYHDGLTGLPNRSMFSKLLTQGIVEAQGDNRHMAVVLLDLNRFKQINDTLGRQAGDQLLRQVADRLKECVRASDTIARLGGDEFVILLSELDDERHAAIVARNVLLGMGKPYTLLGQDLRVTASIGISVYPQDGLDEQTLTKNADVAMYQARAEGRNNFQFYSEKLNANSLQRLALESSLRHASARGEFRLHYQAKRDINSGTITGMEALLRWAHPDLGMVAPMEFVPVAEETGLIVPIGLWVLRTACLQNVAWQAQGLPHLSIAVNLSERQFRDEHLVGDVKATLESTHMDPHLLQLEMSESLLTSNIADTHRILAALKVLGVRLAIDDFGTGYSSLATLQQFPLDTIKIDRSFMRDITGSAANRALADAIITRGKSLGMTVVAQGVETLEQAEFLRTHSCDELQGFYFKRPLPADQFTQLLKAQPINTTSSGRNLQLKAV